MKRLSITEYQPSERIYQDAKSTFNLDRASLNALLQRAGERIQRTLNFNTSPFEQNSKGLLAKGIAGLVRLNSQIELEIIPKFLDSAEHSEDWRSDFYYLATLSKHGQLLANDKLSGSTATDRDLPTLVARAICDMFERNARNPLRHYKRIQERSFMLDGDPDFSEIVTRHPEGFLQESIKYSPENHWNATISTAARILYDEVTDPQLLNRLSRIFHTLGNQKLSRSSVAKIVPSRHRAWEPLYLLSWDIVKGFGLDYSNGSALTPGYVVSTWQLWEDLLSVSSKLGYGFEAVAVQPKFTLAARHTLSGLRAANVYPDIVISPKDKQPFVFDAKYKTNSAKAYSRISEADIYEAMAFAKATGANTVILGYPMRPRAEETVKVGEIDHFETVSLDSLTIYGIEIEVRGISKYRALTSLSSNLRVGLEKLKPIKADALQPVSLT